MKIINDIVNRLLKHWKTTLLSLVVFVITFMYYKKDITTSEWILAIGGLATLAGLFAKDPDKVQTKNEKEE